MKLPLLATIMAALIICASVLVSGGDDNLLPECTYSPHLYEVNLTICGE